MPADNAPESAVQRNSFALEQIAEVRIGSPTDRPTISDVTLIGDSIVLLREGTAYLVKGDLEPIPIAVLQDEYETRQGLFWRLAAADHGNTLILNHPELDHLVVMEVNDRHFYRIPLPKGFTALDICLLADGRYAVGGMQATESVILLVDSDSTTQAIRFPNLGRSNWNPTMHLDTIGDYGLMIASGFPRQIGNVDLRTKQLQLVGAPSWKDDPYLALRANRDYTIDSALERGILLFAARIRDRYFALESVGGNVRRMLLFGDTSVDARTMTGAFGIRDRQPNGCELLAVVWSEGQESLRRMALTAENRRVAC